MTRRRSSAAKTTPTAMPAICPPSKSFAGSALTELGPGTAEERGSGELEAVSELFGPVVAKLTLFAVVSEVVTETDEATDGAFVIVAAHTASVRRKVSFVRSADFLTSQ